MMVGEKITSASVMCQYTFPMHLECVYTKLFDTGWLSDPTKRRKVTDCQKGHRNTQPNHQYKCPFFILRHKKDFAIMLWPKVS